MKSALPGIDWPAIPNADAVQLLCMLSQLERTQWLDPEELVRLQRAQLIELLAYTVDTVASYRTRFGEAGLPLQPSALLDAWSDVPILTRKALQAAGDGFNSRAIPPSHGRVSIVQTSGSTGSPIRTLNTALNQLFWQALTLREHLWHRRDSMGKLVAIRPDRNAPAGHGKALASWGSPVATVFETGPSAVLDSRTDIEAQVQWLAVQKPAYLLTLPSNVKAIAEICIAQGTRIPSLREVRTFGEALEQDLRRACRQAWDVPVTDMYSAQELGYIALQCPENEHYHIQSEHLLVEILDDTGRPCGPREIGRVILTSLHNFATPLIRYEIGDYVEVGEPCACGRRLPVIRRVLGRQRNLAVTPDGHRYWPSFPAEDWMHIAPIRQIQLAQKARDSIEVRYVMDREVEAQERYALTKALHKSLGHPYHLEFRRWKDTIIRNENGKYEDFVCEMKG